MKGATLGKDPAVNWFFNDWNGGTSIFSRHQKGCYMDLLTAQFNNGHLSIDEVKNILGNDFAIWGILSKKFIADSEGKFFNERLEFEINKRKKFTKSRRDNLNGSETSPHMGKGKGLGNEIENRKGIFLSEIVKFKNYSTQIHNDFFEYWSELNKSQTKMRFEKQETFEISKRLATWARNDKTYRPDKILTNAPYKSQQVTMPEGMPDYYSKEYDERLNGSQLQVYEQHLSHNGWKKQKDPTNNNKIIWSKPATA